MVFPMLQTDGIHRAVFDTLPAHTAIFFEVLKFFIIRWQVQCGNDACQSSGRSLFGDKPLGQTESTHAAKIRHMAFRPVAGIGFMDAMNVMIGIHEKPVID